MDKPETLSSPDQEHREREVKSKPPLTRSPSGVHLHNNVKHDSSQDLHEAYKFQIAEDRKIILQLEEKNRLLDERNKGAHEELIHLTNIMKSKVLKTDEELREFSNYSQERATMRAELDTLRAQARTDSVQCAAMRAETEAARTAMADNTRRTEEKDRSMLRLRAALTNFEHRSSKSNLLDFDSELSQVKNKLAGKRKKYKDSKEVIKKLNKDIQDWTHKAADKDARIDSLERDLRTVRSQVDDLHRKIRAEVSSIVSLSHENASLSSDLDRFRKANKELKQREEELKYQLANSRAHDAHPLSVQVLESELAKQLDEMRALQSEELSLNEIAAGEPIPTPSLHTSERAIHLQLEIDKLNTELEEAQKLTKQSESLVSKLKEAKKKTKVMQEDFTERRKVLELTKERSESHLLHQASKEEPPKQQQRTTSNPSLPSEEHKQEGIAQLKESAKVIEVHFQRVRPKEKSNLEQHIEQLLGAVNIPVVKRAEEMKRAAEEKRLEDEKRQQEQLLEDEKKLEEKKLEQKRAAEEQRLEEARREVKNSPSKSTNLAVDGEQKKKSASSDNIHKSRSADTIHKSGSERILLDSRLEARRQSADRGQEEARESPRTPFMPIGKEFDDRLKLEEEKKRFEEGKSPALTPRRIGLERALSGTNIKLARTSSYSVLEANKDVPEDWKEREKALNAQFERLKQVVMDNKMSDTTEAGNPLAASQSIDNDVIALLKPSKVKSADKLQKRITERQERMRSLGVTEMGLLGALVEDGDVKLTESEEEIIQQIPYQQEDDDSLIDKLVRTLAEKYKRAKEANRARILTEVMQLVKDINLSLAHKLTRKEVDTDVEENVQVVNECKKLNMRVVTELENLQIVAQHVRQGKAVNVGWWKGWGTGEENVNDVDAAAKFLIRESQRLYDLRDNFVAVCNKVASLSESVHQCEKDIFKWRLGLEDIHDRLTARMEYAAWGPALSEKLLACRRLLSNHASLRSSLDASRVQRSTMRLLVENFSEGLYVVFAAEAGLEALGSKVVVELTRIRQAERRVMAYKDEHQSIDSPILREVPHKRRVTHIANGGLAGVSLISSMILNYHRLFTRFNASDVPEVIIKSIHYLEERAMDDQGLLLRSYDLPKIAQIKKYFDSGAYDVDISDCMDHRVIAELLKSHLREMKDPLFTADLYRDWMKVDQIESDDDRLTCMRGLIEKLPTVNHSCLAVIMHFLHKVAMNVSINKCTTRLLARVFAPLMLRKR